MSATGADDVVEASYKARNALDEAQQYAELVADFAQMKYMHEGGEEEEAFLGDLVSDDDFSRWGEDYDPDAMEGWIVDPSTAQDAVELYEEAIEDFLDEQKSDLRSALQQAKVAKRSAQDSGSLEASEHRHYTDGDIDPSSVENEIDIADKLVETVDDYVSDVFDDKVRYTSPRRGP